MAVTGQLFASASSRDMNSAQSLRNPVDITPRPRRTNSASEVHSLKRPVKSRCERLTCGCWFLSLTRPTLQPCAVGWETIWSPIRISDSTMLHVQHSAVIWSDPQQAFDCGSGTQQSSYGRGSPSQHCCEGRLPSSWRGSASKPEQVSLLPRTNTRSKPARRASCSIMLPGVKSDASKVDVSGGVCPCTAVQMQPGRQPQPLSP
mmetsp:Transcript_69048/g.202136  ORF Transcript_69048/g.202136 Transcript_69048/m.202136 type:complete len:204 (+) Transcript_69048:2834-3445(+)